MLRSLRRAARAVCHGGAAFACLAAAAIPTPSSVLTTPGAQAPPPEIVRAFAPVCARALRSVVSVLGLREVGGESGPDGPASGPRPAMSLSSGVVVDHHGHVVTSASVVRDCERIQVRLADGRTMPAALLGTDEASDVALLEIPVTDVPPLPWAAPGSDAAGA